MNTSAVSNKLNLDCDRTILDGWGYSRISIRNASNALCLHWKWVSDIVCTWQWWVLVVLLIAPWIVWWRLADKKRLGEICLLGMFVLATATWMDDLGTELILWYYPYKILPAYPQIIPINYAVLPVSYMLIYQYCSPWRSYIRALTIMAALYSWGAEPLLTYMGIYKLLGWKCCYSFLRYILIGISQRWLLERVMAITRQQLK